MSFFVIFLNTRICEFSICKIQTFCGRLDKGKKKPKQLSKNYHFTRNNGERFKNLVRAEKMVLAVKTLAA